MGGRCWGDSRRNHNSNITDIMPTRKNRNRPTLKANAKKPRSKGSGGKSSAYAYGTAKKTTRRRRKKKGR